MTQLAINHQTAQKLEELSKRAKKSVDDIISVWVNNFGYAVIDADQSAVDDDVTWTEEELVELIKPKTPLTGKQIIEGGFIGGWEHKNIDDPVAFLEKQRAS